MNREADAAAEDAAIEAAVKAEQLSNDPRFVFIRQATKNLPGLRQRLEQEAKASGRMLVAELGEPPAVQLARARDERLADTPVVPRDNKQAFLDNLAAIAAGKIRVT